MSSEPEVDEESSDAGGGDEGTPTRKQAAPRRRSTPRRAAAAKRKSYIESTDEEEEKSLSSSIDGSNSSEVAADDDIKHQSQVKSPPAKKRTDTGTGTKKRAPASRSKRPRGDSSDDEEEEFNTESKPNKKRNKPTCPHCKKSFAVKVGLDYHLENFVCLPDQKPTADKSSVDKPKKKKPKQVRGAETKRTCPKCKRVFTSTHGLDYHLQKRVCDNPKKQSSKPFDTLQSGMKFSTKFGVVQVVKDDRAVPNAILANDAKQKLKCWYSAIGKRDAQCKKLHSCIAVETRARRTLLQRAYVTGNVTQASVFEASFDKDPRNISPEERPAIKRAATVVPDDPMAPEGSFPDRIVECIMVADKRTRFIGPDESEPMEGTADQPPCHSTPVRVYLQRSLLTNVYNEDSGRHYCPKCWRWFTSKPGCKYHIDSDACTKKAAKEKAEADALLKSIDKRSKQLLVRREYEKDKSLVVASRQGRRQVRTVAPPEAASFRDSKGKFAGPRVVTVADQSALIAAAEDDVAVEKKKKKSSELKDDDLVSPDDMIADLEAQLYRLHGQMLGPMYPAVWKSLGYKKPKVKKVLKRKKTTKRKRRKTKSSPEAPALEPEDESHFEESLAQIGLEIDSMERTAPQSLGTRPPIIDTRVFIGEVDAGRYPSIKRFTGKHDNKCAICKSESSPMREELLPCNFCKQVAHFSCALTKWTLKDPEPEEDFLCFSCIQVIMARRNRAEKRRIEKLTATGKPVVSEEEKLKESVQLTKGAVVGREFESVAAQGRQVDELSELLRDAKARLAISLEIEAMNRARRALLDSVEVEGTMLGTEM